MNSEQLPPRATRTSPWEKFSEQRRASARAFKDLSNELGQAFRTAQQESYEQWCVLDQQTEKDCQNK